MRKLLVANWKENPGSEGKALRLFREIADGRRNIDVVICPPFVYLEGIAAIFRTLRANVKKNLALGAQDIFWEEKGAYTGEVGSLMVKSLGVRNVIIGHSERRKYAKETDSVIHQKIKAAITAELNVVLCVGESIAVRKKGIEAAQAFIKDQLKKDLAGIDKMARGMRNKLIIAYEPIWAIGTGMNDKPEDAAEMARFIKKTMLTIGIRTTPRFLYGGSVNSKNIQDYVQYKDIDGALVGGASLKATEFKKIINHING